MKLNYPIALILVLVTALTAACAKTKLQMVELTITESVLAVSQVEQALYEAGVEGYTKTDHDKVGSAILRALYATRAFEKAVTAGTQSDHDALATLYTVVTASFEDIEHALPAAAPVREPLLKALEIAREAVAIWKGRAS